MEEYKLMEAQAGDEDAKNLIIKRNRKFILQVAGRACNRYVTWKDDEASIALIAFNDAINTYNPGKKLSFLNYAGMVIRSKLIDYLRKEYRKGSSAPELVYTDVDTIMNVLDYQNSLTEHFLRQEAKNRQFELTELRKELLKYNVDLLDLAGKAPRHNLRREKCVRVAYYLANNEILLSKFIRNKKIPIKELEKFTGVSRKTIEGGRKFIIALIIIIKNPVDFRCIYSYITPYLEEEIN